MRRKVSGIQWAVAVMMVAGFASAELIENFDWGTGVTGRESIVLNNSINNKTTLDGNYTWAATSSGFKGSAGEGNGRYELGMGGGNSVLRTDFSAQSGVVTASMVGTYDNLGSGTRGMYFGFQTVDRDADLIQNDTRDRINLRLNGANGNVLFTVVAGGVTNTGTITTHGTWSYAAGNQFKFDLNIDTVNKTVYGVVSNLTAGVSRSSTVDYSASTIAPAWTSLTAAMSGTGVVTLDSITAIPEPATLGMFMISAVSLLLARRFVN
jgi:hypothetical protein